MSSRANTTHTLESLMLVQEKISGPEALLKLYCAFDFTTAPVDARNLLEIYDHKSPDFIRATILLPAQHCF